MLPNSLKIFKAIEKGGRKSWSSCDVCKRSGGRMSRRGEGKFWRDPLARGQQADTFARVPLPTLSARAGYSPTASGRGCVRSQRAGDRQESPLSSFGFKATRPPAGDGAPERQDKERCPSPSSPQYHPPATSAYRFGLSWKCRNTRSQKAGRQRRQRAS